MNGFSLVSRIRDEAENGYPNNGGITMRKTFVGVITAAMVLSIGATSVFAVGSGTGRNYVDADGDGVCDRADRVCSYVDADNDGICDNRGACQASETAGARHGRQFIDADGDGVCDNTDRVCSYVDADNDGICDNREACQASETAGARRGRQFIDADGDGVCDNAAAGQGRGKGKRNNGQGGCSR